MDSAPDSPLHRSMPRRSRAWLAVSLTLLCPGWGHLYVGAVARGLLVALLNVAVIVPGVVWMWVAWAQGPATALIALGVTLAFLIALPADAARCALREPRGGGRRSSPVRVVVLHGLFVPIAVTLLHSELSWIRANRVQPFQTPTESMVPTLLPGDFFLVDTRPATRAELQPGDIIVFDHPRMPGVAYAKRVVALAGGRVSIETRGLVVGGVLRTDPSHGPWQRMRTERLAGHRYNVSLGSPGELEAFGPVSVPEDHVFVLGDSRVHSRDSREFGPLPLEQVRGRVVRIFWSFDPVERRVRWSRLGLGFVEMGR
jgi:signal peptidase I